MGGSQPAVGLEMEARELEWGGARTAQASQRSAGGPQSTANPQGVLRDHCPREGPCSGEPEWQALSQCCGYSAQQGTDSETGTLTLNTVLVPPKNLRNKLLRSKVCPIQSPDRCRDKNMPRLPQQAAKPGSLSVGLGLPSPCQTAPGPNPLPSQGLRLHQRP